MAQKGLLLLRCRRHGTDRFRSARGFAQIGELVVENIGHGMKLERAECSGDGQGILDGAGPAPAASDEADFDSVVDSVVGTGRQWKRRLAEDLPGGRGHRKHPAGSGCTMTAGRAGITEL